MTFFLTKGRGLTVDENGFGPLQLLNPNRPGDSGTANQLLQTEFIDFYQRRAQVTASHCVRR